MTTTIVNVRRQDFDIYIGRAAPRAKDPRCRQTSPWHNPFKLGPGDSRRGVIDRYRTYIFEKLAAAPALRMKLAELRGKRLGCWCSPKLCHGDVLAELAHTPGEAAGCS